MRQAPQLGDRVRVEHHQLCAAKDGTRFMVAVEIPGVVTAVDVDAGSFRWRPYDGFDMAECWLPVNDERWRLAPTGPLSLGPPRPPGAKP